ncbi:DUF1835 domain-containing protein [Brenneria nigrifluens DSM 30175 = ATCC 13028]|uniref:DUF1835 domain-containing protein n=1 Tax=Brenneria nigrifluens DSM 30175 = ATCC 13028 TaxID=1121120 RepID=A0A2U1UQ00_9GAMM|nr:DUF1835 domain-containing protein [Brenneria nigrifluens DSM 30175 = ATCC 13028]QCR03855.1 DUF1835 domain-containing protein [Brenneria nigrifluens DSM 30175 = ATCC 13028]
MNRYAIRLSLFCLTGGLGPWKRGATVTSSQSSVLSSPFRINLEQQRKRAKALRDAIRQSHPEAIARFLRYRPSLTPAQLAEQFGRLSDAQWIIAQELGLPSWPRLKAHVEAMAHARTVIDAQSSAPDHALSTLHIRCGSDIQQPLRQAGFRGDYLAYSDPFCQGPVLTGDDWLPQRVAFIASHYTSRIGISRQQLQQQREQEERTLLSAGENYRRVVLWFEHDSYDQLILARCLAHFDAHPAPLLEMVTVDRYPGSRRFLGLGQLPTEALLLLWQARQPVTPRQCRLGRQVWEGLRSDNPSTLLSLATAVAADLPFMPQALLRHCQEFPSVKNGLGLTEQLALRCLAERPHTPKQLFHTLTEHHDPLPWLGDIMLDDIIDGLRLAPEPALSLDAASGVLSLTEVGRALLDNRLDWMNCYPAERWLGGVRIDGGQRGWRWHQQSQKLVLTR